MDAKSRANFINSIGGGQKIPCPNCNTLNDADATFCVSCGTKLKKDTDSQGEQDIVNGGINSLEVRCPKCNIINEPGAVFCGSCGAKLNVPVNGEINQRQQQAVSTKAIFKPVASIVQEEPEEASVFAQGLPSWDIVPPQVMVRRKRK